MRTFRREFNAAVDAGNYVHVYPDRGEMRGGIWEARSNGSSAWRIMDGDEGTWWQPDEEDHLFEWTVEIDLGRAVLAREIDLVFPEEEEARPFPQ